MLHHTLTPPCSNLLTHRDLVNRSTFSFAAPGHAVGKTWKHGRLVTQCALPDNPGEDPPETLFMRELRRRGLSQAKDEESRSGLGTETKVDINEAGSGLKGGQNQNVTSLLDEKKQADQRKQSMALNSEGLEGLIPRAQSLLSLGGSFFLAFWPLILSSVTVFAALYVYYGPIFVHAGPRAEDGQHPVVDPYELLENEQIPPDIGPFVPFSKR